MTSSEKPSSDALLQKVRNSESLVRSLDNTRRQTYLASKHWLGGEPGAAAPADVPAGINDRRAMSSQLQYMQQGTLIEDQYLLERQLGAGGMGTVWVARDLRLARSVAIKFLSGDFHNDEPARLRFEREARMASKIRSPHVVQVFAAGITAEGVPYVVMELLDGEDLDARLQRNGPCSLVETGVIVEQVCRALSRSHREGLVHRDIKPHNIFLMPEAGGQLFAKLLDFGIAKDTGAKATTLTVTGAVVGSVFYISPEQLRDAPSVDHQADLWALGVVIYQMLTGSVPFDGDSLPELLLRITECRYQPATRLNPGLPKEIDAFLSRAITSDRSQRYASADELASSFARIVRANSSGFVRKPEISLTPRAAESPSAPSLPPEVPSRVSQPTAATQPRRVPAWLWMAAVVALCGAGAVFALRPESTAQRESIVLPAQAAEVPHASQPDVLGHETAHETGATETSVHSALNADLVRPPAPPPSAANAVEPSHAPGAAARGAASHGTSPAPRTAHALTQPADRSPGSSAPSARAREGNASRYGF